VFDKVEGLKFKFSDYIKTLTDGKTGTGKYTAQYQARDAAGLLSTKTYTITLNEEFIDDVKPSVKVKFDKYLYLGGDVKSYTVPTATVSDAGSASSGASRIETQYTVNGGSGAGGLDVKSGEKLDIEYVDATTVLLKNAGYKNISELDPDKTAKKDKLSMNIFGLTKLTLSVKAIDSAGNETSVGGDPDGDLALITDDIISAQNLDLNIGAVSYEGTSGSTISFDGMKTTIERETDSGSPNFDKFELGSFAITGIEHEYRNFVGFEMKLTRDKDGKEIILNNLSFETFYVSPNTYSSITGGKGMRVVDKIVAALSDGDYNLAIRVFDVSGGSIVRNYSIKIDEDGSGSGQPVLDSAAAIPYPGGNVNETYLLNNSESFAPPAGGDPDRRYMVRRILNAGNFALMGHEFTAYAQGGYSFNDGSYLTSGEFKGHQSYTFSATDIKTPIFEVQGVMPWYADKDTVIDLPSVVAHNTYANADITVTVKGPAPANTPITPDFDGATNSYSFKGTENGVYTVTYTASINNARADQKFDIRVGDHIAPEFTFTAQTARKAGSYFKFSKMVVDKIASAADLSSTSDDLADIKFTKELITPSEEVIRIEAEKGAAAADRQVKSGWDSEGYKLDESGDYTVRYIAEDRYGNQSEKIDSFHVSSDSKSSALAVRVIATVLVIIAVLLIVGLILYFTRFQKKKIKKA
jgi:hypothetical protein